MENSNKPTLKVIIAGWLMIIFWASAYIGIRAGLNSFAPGSLALLRYLVASICMFFIYVRIIGFQKIALRDCASIAILGFFGFTIYNIALNYSESTVTAATASFIISQVPVFVILFAIIFFGEQLSLLGWLGVLISFIGILLISLGHEAFKMQIGVLYALISTLAGSIYSIFQKPLLKRIHPIEFTAYAIWFGTLALLIYLPQLLLDLPKASGKDIAWVVYIGIFPAALGYFLWSYVLTHIPASKAASYLYVVPIVTTIMGWLILDEAPTFLVTVGGFIALAGSFLVYRYASIKQGKIMERSAIKAK